MKNNFKVGDRVRIRQWEDMEKELKKDSDGDLRTILTCFTKNMKCLCGRSATIEIIESNGEVKLCKWSNSEKTNYCFDIDMIEPYKSDEPEQITITRYGQKVVAKLGKKVGVAKCSPEDEFDFNVGAKLAFARLMGEEKTENFDKVEYKEVKRPAKVGEYIKLIQKSFAFSEVGDILKVSSVEKNGLVKVLGKDHPRDTKHPEELWNYTIIEYVVLENYQPKEEPKKEEFKPYLKSDWSGSHYGNIGEETPFTDVFEEKLYVGDVVELYNAETKRPWGERVVIYTLGKYGVMGVHMRDFKNGISDHWRIRKVKSYKDLKHNEKIEDIIAILKEE